MEHAQDAFLALPTFRRRTQSRGHPMRRLIIFFAMAAAFVLTGTSALAGGPVDGTSAGRETGAPNASATCDYGNRTKPSDYFCRYVLHGSYFDDNPILGDGTYTGTIIQNWGNGGA